MKLEETGTFSARAFTAGGALPTEGATVRITGAEEANRGVYYSLITDIDGVTEKIVLPAPATLYSLEPTPTEPPYALYDIEVTKDGYYSKRILGIKIFAGRHTELPINMIPDSEGTDNGYPRGNLNADVFGYQ